MFEKVHADALLYALDKRGILATLGGGSMQKLSHLLENVKGFSHLSHSALGFAMSRATTVNEVNEAVKIISEEVKRLKSYSEKLEMNYAGV